MKKIAIPVAIMLLASPLSADDFSAEMVLSKCGPILEASEKGDTEIMLSSYDSGFCVGAFRAFQNIIAIRPPLLDVCAPPESTTLQLLKVVKKYADSHPEETHRNFIFLAQNALVAHWRCTSPPSE